MEESVILKPKELHELIQKKLQSAGLREEHANEVAKHLVFADSCGIHSHGAVRVDYYAERISKGGVNINPNMHFEKTGVCTGIFHGDNGIGQYVAKEAMKYAIDMAKEMGVSIVGVSKMSHSGALAYYVEEIAKNNLIGISMCQSDPMVVPYGGSEPYYGTNPIAFSAPASEGKPIVFDMATSIQAWGKILYARSKNMEIPNTWAVDKNGIPTKNPHEVGGLLPIAGPKGYGLMMVVDVLSGVLLGLPFGGNVSSMYDKLSEGRDLGQIYIVIDPAKFIGLDRFKEDVTKTKEELHKIKVAEGFKQVYYPGEVSQLQYDEYQKNGIPISKPIYDYLVSDIVHFDKFGGQSAFASDK
ncbi:ureidoglycolate dehydrogenase [Oceanivirga salmonicida]|uniref:ureidoglycolate dehydrogenase n=1 Tax=Oceanivirga salmonicida TaxID=1769291 RepID=UPI0008375DD0|nr:ureidoglycolate dehydrogenase [Oceanivirga salmonicida]